MTTAANWFFNWLLAYITPYLTGKDHAHLGSNIFWIWGAFCWIAVVFVYFFIYETKNLSLEEVSELYGSSLIVWERCASLTIIQKPRARRGKARLSGQRCLGVRPRARESTVARVWPRLVKPRSAGGAVWPIRQRRSRLIRRRRRKRTASNHIQSALGRIGRLSES